MADIEKARHHMGELKYPENVQEALEAVTELPEDPEEQAEFFDKIQESLSTRLRDDS
jgi:hypothetical protein